MDIHSCHLLFDHFQFALIHGPDIPGSYAVLLFTASDLASITSYIHSWVLFLFWLHPFILSGVISPLISSSILGTYRPGEFLFQHLIILPFHTVDGFSRQEYTEELYKKDLHDPDNHDDVITNLEPDHFCPLSSPSLHEVFPWYL